MLDSLSRSVVVPARLVILMWAVFFVEITWFIDLSFLGIIPRSLSGIQGILCGPLLHGNFWHLTSNTIPLLFLGTTLYFVHEKKADVVFFYCYFLTSLLVWLFARPSIHIGASGLVYGLAFFLIFYGFFRKDFRSLFISCLVLIMYGGLFYGLLPVQRGVSWESHLLGAFVGFFLALRYGRAIPPRKRKTDYFY